MFALHNPDHINTSALTDNRPTQLNIRTGSEKEIFLGSRASDFGENIAINIINK